MPFRAVATQRLYQQVAQQIADLIRSGELPAGDRLPAERDLARQIGVSRPTIREAMIALEIAGLVEVRTGSGVYVLPVLQDGNVKSTTDSPTSFDVGPSPFDVLAARLLFEPEIAAAAAGVATQEAVSAIAGTIQALKTASDHRASLEADHRFHTLIAEATGNGVLVTVVQDLWASMSSPVFEALSSRTGLPATDQMTVEDHRKILRHVAANEPEHAREAMREHLKHVQDILSRSDELPGHCPNHDPAGL